VASEYVARGLSAGRTHAATCTPAFVLGIVNVRGEILSVIDIKKFFELPEKD